MARIRSIHPGQWTDEAFVAVSPLARLLALGLRNEADDEGVFPWKPLTLKMRLLPADNADVAVLLAELEAANIVRKYEVDGVHYGAIRNFYLFQRPKFPKLTHPRLPWVPAYCGHKKGLVPQDDGSGSEPMTERFGTDAEIAPQMESESESKEGMEGGTGETEPSSAPKQNTGPKARAKPSKRVRSLDDLELDDELRGLARRNGKDPEVEIDKFRDWVRAKGKRFDDYRAAFRNWLRQTFGQLATVAQKPIVNPSDPLGHLSPWQRTQLKQRAEEQVKSEGGNPWSPEGEARVRTIIRESADAQRRTA